MFLMLVLAISTINAVIAADITLNPNSPGGLKQAINTAKNGDTILLNNGLYNGENNTNITIKKDINIKGLGSNVILDGQGKNLFFNITGKKVSLIKLKFTNGYSNFSAPISHIKGNLTIKDCIFTNNEAFYGGAIYSEKGNLSIMRCTFKNNKGSHGGAILTESKTNINKCIFTNNKADFWGGAINSERISLTVKNSIFTNNKGSCGGAISLFGKSTISNCSFKNNKATTKEIDTSEGGAIILFGKSTINKCNFKNNTARDGAGAIQVSANTKITGSTFTDNKSKRGGAIFAELVGQHDFIPITLKIENSKFTKNIVGKKYNAIVISKKVTLTKKNVKISPKDGTKV